MKQTRPWKTSERFEDAVPETDANGMAVGQIQVEITRVGKCRDNHVIAFLQLIIDAIEAGYE